MRLTKTQRRPAPQRPAVKPLPQGAPSARVTIDPTGTGVTVQDLIAAHQTSLERELFRTANYFNSLIQQAIALGGMTWQQQPTQ